MKIRRFYENGLTKNKKTTIIYIDEYSCIIEIQTNNINLKSLRKNIRNATTRPTMTSKWAKQNGIVTL